MKEINKKYSLQKLLKIFSIFLIPIIILNILISFIVIDITKKESLTYLENTASIYIKQINENFNSIRKFMGYTAVSDENLKLLSEMDKKEIYKYPEVQNQLYQRFLEFQTACGDNYNFFIYLKDQDYFFNCGAMNIDLKQYNLIKDMIKKNKDIAYKEFGTYWNYTNLDNNEFVFNILPYNNVLVCCFAEKQQFLKPLTSINLGERGYVEIKDNKNSIEKNKHNFLLYKVHVTSFFDKSNFGVDIVFNNLDILKKIIFIQAIIFILAITSCVLISLSLYIMKNRILKPIKYFSVQLDNINTNINLYDNDILELQQANEEFNKLINQIKSLKISLYERELEKQKIKMNYMNLQIRPHFFLNCLTNIYSMSQLNMNEDIQKMCLSTSRYFRYIFSTKTDFVKLENEVNHICDYLSIHKTTLGDCFNYEINIQSDINDAKIPPLLLQTFVENSIKHGINLNNNSIINIDISSIYNNDDKQLQIIISDNGKGFSTDILEKLNSLDFETNVDGTGVGIHNTIERLKYLYQNNFDIKFSNTSSGGANIKLTIPYILYDNKEEV